MCFGLHNPKTSLWGLQKMIKMYFHIVYGGAKRRYGGAGRNNLITWTLAEMGRSRAGLFLPAHPYLLLSPP